MAHFPIEQVLGFYAVYGFVSCAALIVVAKLIGLLIKRDERYYDDA